MEVSVLSLQSCLMLLPCSLVSAGILAGSSQQSWHQSLEMLKECVLQGNYTVNPGANPDSHLWILCNPDIPRKTPFLLDLGGSVLIFEVSPSSLGITHTGRALASKSHSSMDRVPWQQAEEAGIIHWRVHICFRTDLCTLSVSMIWNFTAKV